MKEKRKLQKKREKWTKRIKIKIKNGIERKL